MGRFQSVFGAALLLGSAGVLLLALRNLLMAIQSGTSARAGLIAAYHAPGIVTNGVIAFALFVFGVGLLRSAQQQKISRLVIGALGLIAVVLLGIRAGLLG